jgi:broad specificity phosphatase PhoE
MKRLAFSLFLFASLSVAAANPFVVIVRHAEKASTGGRDLELSPAGNARAEKLGRMLKDAGITAIFTSELKRTKQTAAPIAASLGIEPAVVAAKDTAELVEKLRAVHGNALVVGHGNTIPELATALGVKTPLNISEDDYDQVFVVTLGESPQLLRLHFP